MFKSLKSKVTAVVSGALVSPLAFATTPAGPANVQELIATIDFSDTTTVIMQLAVLLMGITAVAASVNLVLNWFRRGSRAGS